ncbi:hypothetical protein MBLNU459_g3136t1 [Dothideomycetes sp. NU459]
MAEKDLAIKSATEDTAFPPSPVIPPKSPSKTSPRRSRSPMSQRRPPGSDLPASGDSSPRHQLEPSEDGEMADDKNGEAPPLPDEPLPGGPPLPNEPVPVPVEDDGWEAFQDPNTFQYYFVNRFTGVSQWENPRVPNNPHASGSIHHSSGAPGTAQPRSAPGVEPEAATKAPSSPPKPYFGYNPKIHGDYDPNADYARYHEEPVAKAPEPVDSSLATNLIGQYEQAGTFNRFTGTFQAADKSAEYHNDENKSHRQMNAYFDVDRAANTHDGRSLKAERANKKLSKKEVKAFNDERRAKKEKKRRDFLMS